MKILGIILIVITIGINILFDPMIYRYISMVSGILGIYVLLKANKNGQEVGKY